MRCDLSVLMRGAVGIATALFLNAQASAATLLREATIGEPPPLDVMTSLAVMGLLPQPGPRIRAGRVLLEGCDVTQLQPWQRVEAGHGRMAMIFQEPMTSLNPVRRIGDQIAEAVRVHECRIL